jgi:hypothetical protein
MTVQEYLDLITSEHKDKPLYTEVLKTLIGFAPQDQQAQLDLINKFDLDAAVGSQLDTIGLWVGITRAIPGAPIAGVYFSFNIEGLGFNQGVWFGRDSISAGVTTLDDDAYRVLLRNKIAANNCDGTMQSYRALLANVFVGSGVVSTVVDNYDMSMTVFLTGDAPTALLLQLIVLGYLPLKPSGVHINYVGASAPSTPIFAFDLDTSAFAGFGTGSWATQL